MDPKPSLPTPTRRLRVASATCIALVGLALLTVTLRWHFLRVPLISDEGAYGYVARLCGAGHQLYADLPFDRPQGIFLLYAIPVAFGGTPFAIRIFAALYAAAGVVALQRCGREVLSERAGWLAAIAAAVAGTAPSVEGFTANAELFTLLPITLSAHAAWRGRFGWAGLFAGVAALVKPSGASALLLAAAWALTAAGTPRGRSLLRLATGFAVVLLLSIVHGASVGFHAYLASFLERRLFLYSVMATPASEQVTRLGRAIVTTAPAWAALAGTAAITVLRVRSRSVSFCLVWLMSSCAGMAMGGEWHAHYFQQAIPPLALLAGAAPDTLRDARWRAAWLLPIIAGIVLFVRVDLPYWSYTPMAVSAARFRRVPYLFAEDAARLLAARTKPDDRIYVAVSEPEVYYFARRRAAVPQLFLREFFYSGVRARVLASLEAEEPAAVALSGSPPGMPYEQFESIVSRHYVQFGEAGPFRLFERRRRFTVSAP